MRETIQGAEHIGKLNRTKCRYNFVHMTLILFMTNATHPLTEELSQRGWHIFEVIATSEVLALAAQHPNAAIILTAEVEPGKSQGDPALPNHAPENKCHNERNLWELNLKGATIQ